MPLFQKSRVEIYIPSASFFKFNNAYDRLLKALESELTQKHGGCSILGGMRGNYKMDDGSLAKDHIRLLYVDLPFSYEEHYDELCRYTDHLREDIGKKLKNEEAILIVAYAVQWSEA